MKVTVVSRSGREVIKGGLELSDSATVADLQEAIHKRIDGLVVGDGLASVDGLEPVNGLLVGDELEPVGGRFVGDVLGPVNGLFVGDGLEPVDCIMQVNKRRK
ncbi:hypothetical protein H0E87_019695 [Populus deltoides]|uniref:Uncharacterized protein n=1 Tax=Populus deltoides TaxID=3696 RepID=A0A8T2XW82_POPDE|nr:hypothetical protein H0E87_019695 [Populus deltoides]